jgi:hypothetical protein
MSLQLAMCCVAIAWFSFAAGLQSALRGGGGIPKMAWRLVMPIFARTETTEDEWRIS